MKNFYSCIIFLIILDELSSQVGKTFLENFLGPYRTIKLFQQQLISGLKRPSPMRQKKLQSRISQFPCDLNNTRSSKKPQSVHQLRPGDIDVVGAIGDSLTAGIGITAVNLLELSDEERGKSFSIGGEGDWQQFLTLPNILKIFNPHLVGYSLKSSLSIQKESQLNVAEVMAVSADVPYMTRQLIERIKTDPRIDVAEDWKMITVFIGANDFCSNFCETDDLMTSLEQHKRDVFEFLRLLRDNLPRTIVNYVIPPNLRILVELNIDDDPLCYFTHLLECPCLFGLPNHDKKTLFYDSMSMWQKIDMEVCNLAEFDKNDFTVVVQPFLLNYTFPTRAPNVADLRYLSADCFHWSQKAHAKVANDLWNNIMEPIGMKSVDGNRLFGEFNCPTKENPYIFTRRNSLN